MNKYLRPLIFILTLVALASCVTMNNYRETKSQMLAGEIELTMCHRTIDSLSLLCYQQRTHIERLDSVVINQHKQINAAATQYQRLISEYNSLLDQNKKNEVQKSSPKTKR